MQYMLTLLVIIHHVIAIFKNVRSNRFKSDNVYPGFWSKYCKRSWMINIENRRCGDRNWSRACGLDCH
jgi:hypothetical protein